MIAKITRGGSAGGLAVYLHGPGAGTEHAVEVDGQRVADGMVVASNVPGSRWGTSTGVLGGGGWIGPRPAAQRSKVRSGIAR